MLSLTRRCRGRDCIALHVRWRHAVSRKKIEASSGEIDYPTEKLEEYQWVHKILYSSTLSAYSGHQLPSILIRAAKKSEQWPGTSTKTSGRCSALKYFEDVLPETDQRLKELETVLSLEEASDEPNQYPFQIYTQVKEKIVKHSIESEKASSQHSDDGVEEQAYSWGTIYGEPDSRIPPSKIPCGGCGALLHCQDTGIPGYIPSDSFKKLTQEELRTQICQRCFYLKEHNAALNVNVSKEDYPKILETMRNKRALVILVVDLIDFPCSIWPGILDIIGERRPVILVGNKVDLIPRDSKNYLEHIRSCLYSVASSSGLKSARIIHTALISAASGYGVEELITAIHEKWDMKGDIYLVGCTNVGKSTLYNTLLQSDMCKVQAVDLMHRATVSEWPGTTLNLLKRLWHWKEEQENERKLYEFQLQKTKNPYYAQLIGRVGRSYDDGFKQEEIELINDHASDIFQIKHNSVNLPRLTKAGSINLNDPDLAAGKWCFDTPGTVNENQILDQFRLPELMKLIPKRQIRPRTYFIKQNHTLFVAGISRIDFVEGDYPVRFTVFSSDAIPITICETSHAEEVFTHAFGTPIFGIPRGDHERLSQFPPLIPQEFAVEGEGHYFSCADIVISATGWVAITAAMGSRNKFQVHTPGGKGSYLRQPALLPNMVRLRGRRIRHTYTYGPHRLYIPPLIRREFKVDELGEV